MIVRIEALNYRCLRDVSQELGPFNVLVGPNASGKSSFLDVVGLVSDFVNHGLTEAILIGPEGRARRIEELFFHGQGDRFELGVELEIPQGLRHAKRDRIRYEVAFGRTGSGELVVFNENIGFLAPSSESDVSAPPGAQAGTQQARHSLLSVWSRRPASPALFVSVGRERSGLVRYDSEIKAWSAEFKVAPEKSALTNVPEEPEKFPVTLWARDVLRDGVRRIALNVDAMRQPSSPSLPTTLLPDGSNLPRVVESLRTGQANRFKEWIAHVQTVLPDLKTIDVITQEHDRHTYLRLHHTSGDPVPAWLVSDGTLRMLALTILPYLVVRDRVYLIEEPENGVHPQAIESVLDALSSVYDNQVLLATHSPMLMSRAELKDLLCFKRGKDGAAEVIRGDRHPYLADWKGEVSLSTLYASGVLS